MSEERPSLVHALREQFQAVLAGIQPPVYRSAVQVVYPHLVWPETAKSFPAVCFELRESRALPEKSAMGREEREFVYRLIAYARDSWRASALEQTENLATDVERALAAGFSAARAALAQTVRADLVEWRGPDWQRLETNWRKPYGVALGLVTARVRYDHGDS
ncbi:MAG: hypothetical protein GX444_08250 [Myxococcales bacterium]|nr:hypothetical protein [Myxococcales bacterium]